MTDLWLSGVFSSSKYSKTRFRPYDAPPNPLVGWVGGHPLPIPFPLDAFGVLISAHLGCHAPPPTQIPGNAYENTHNLICSKAKVRHEKYDTLFDGYTDNKSCVQKLKYIKHKRAWTVEHW